MDTATPPGGPWPWPSGYVGPKLSPVRWADVHLDKGTLSVRRGLHRVSGQGLVYEEPKAERGRRTGSARAAPAASTVGGDVGSSGGLAIDWGWV